MSYQPLARKYRPASFNELVGQEAVATALANAIRLGLIPPVVLFSGVRGIGKTTTARLYAKALNCENGPTSEPCNACESCQAITRGYHEDVLEIDGASNTGVSDVRALQETIDYVPQRSKYKIYIIDEVHMLSTAAFNALLKTLEEPPSHVVFVFATTEMDKVPQTIKSRCQTFYLKKLTTAVIQDRLATILQRESIDYEVKALAAIAREGHGSMRDALTLLDQAIALGEGRVTTAALSRMITTISSSSYIQLLGAMVDRDAKAAMEVISSFDQTGVEFTAVVEQAAKFARHAFVLRDLGVEALDTALLGLDQGEITSMQALAEKAPAFDLNRIFRTLTKCRQELDGSTLDRYICENYIFEWCLDPGLPDIEGLLSGAVSAAGENPAKPASAPVRRASASTPPPRMSDVMAELRGGVKTAASRPVMTEPRPQGAAAVSAGRAGESEPAPSPAKAPQQEEETSEVSFPPSWRELVDTWKHRKPLQARKLEEAHPLAYAADKIVLAVAEDSYASKSLLAKEEQNRIREQFRELFGFQGMLEVLPKSEALRAAGSQQGVAANHLAPSAGAPERDRPKESAVSLGRPEAPILADDALLPDTLLTVRTREEEERRLKVATDAQNAPFTKEVLAVLGGNIENVRIHGDRH